jgi:precorrin-8X/cobalt-precorrin-8 methylmutase
MRPEEIEAESFRIIDGEAGSHGWGESEWQIVRRVVHTSADFEYVRSMVMSDCAVEKAVTALKSGAGIVTDTTMALSGISKPRLAPFGCRVSCHVADPANLIFVIGNAPTALFELLRLTAAGALQPALIIGLPVGFVGAEESKNALAATDGDIPFITNIGRKGGSNVAAAVVNALAILATAQR